MEKKKKKHGVTFCTITAFYCSFENIRKENRTAARFVHFAPSASLCGYLPGDNARRIMVIYILSRLVRGAAAISQIQEGTPLY